MDADAKGYEELSKQKDLKLLKRNTKTSVIFSFMLSEQMCSDRKEQFEAVALYYLSEDELRKLFQHVGLFTNVVIKQITDPYHFKAYQTLKRWVKASKHHDTDDMDPDFVKAVLDKVATFHDDGSMTTDTKEISIIACM